MTLTQTLGAYSCFGRGHASIAFSTVGVLGPRTFHSQEVRMAQSGGSKREMKKPRLAPFEMRWPSEGAEEKGKAAVIVSRGLRATAPTGV